MLRARRFRRQIRKVAVSVAVIAAGAWGIGSSRMIHTAGHAPPPSFVQTTTPPVSTVPTLYLGADQPPQLAEEPRLRPEPVETPGFDDLQVVLSPIGPMDRHSELVETPQLYSWGPGSGYLALPLMISTPHSALAIGDISSSGGGHTIGQLSSSSGSSSAGSSGGSSGAELSRFPAGANLQLINDPYIDPFKIYPRPTLPDVAPTTVPEPASPLLMISLTLLAIPFRRLR